jgi:hypothetical protein
MPKPHPAQPTGNAALAARRQLHDALLSTHVPISLIVLTNLLDEVDRLRSLLGEKRADAEGEPETVIPLLKPEKE